MNQLIFLIISTMVLIYIYSQMKMLFVNIFRHIGIDSIHRIANNSVFCDRLPNGKFRIKKY